VIWLRETLGAKSGAAYSGRSQAVYAALAEARFVIVILLSIPSNVDFIGDFVRFDAWTQHDSCLQC